MSWLLLEDCLKLALLSLTLFLGVWLAEGGGSGGMEPMVFFAWLPVLESRLLDWRWSRIELTTGWSLLFTELVEMLSIISVSQFSGF